MPENAQQRTENAGMRLMFWVWMTIIVVGLAVMIAIPLGGN